MDGNILTQMILLEADLIRTRFWSLKSWYHTRADLEWTYLEKMDLGRMDLRRADLERMGLGGADLCRRDYERGV